MSSGSFIHHLGQMSLAATAMCALLVGDVAIGQHDTAPTETEPAARILWKYAPAGSQFSGVIAKDGTVVALDRSGKIHALDAASGKVQWITKGGLPLSFGFGIAWSPKPGFDAILVGCDEGLMALDRKTGKKLWHTDIAMGVAGPACTMDVVIAGGADGLVYACDLTTGKMRWQHEFLEDAPEDPEGFAGDSARLGERPARPGKAATDGKIVVIPVFDQCRMLALDVADGKRLWDCKTNGWVGATPEIGPRNVFVGSQDRYFYAADKETGKLSWKVKTRGRVSGSGASTERFIYFGSCDAYLYAVDQVVGRVMWKFETDHEEGYGASIYSRPLLLGDTVYLAAMSGKVYAVNRKDGTLRWSLRPSAKSDINSDLVTDAGRMFVTTRKRGKTGESAVIAIDSRPE